MKNIKNYIYIFFILILSKNIFSQPCSRYTIQNDTFGVVSDKKSTGWMLYYLMSDEFNSDDLNESKWEIYNDICHDMSKKAYFKKTEENVSIVDGKLVLRTNPDSSFTCDSSKILNYSSGYVVSKQPIQYGLIEMKCRMPHEKALNPSFWTYGSAWENGSESRYDEIDIFESVFEWYTTNVFRQNVWRKIHTPTDTNIQADLKFLNYPNSYADQEMIIAVEWLPTEINFYVNGKWTNGVKYTSNPNYISPVNFTENRSIFTCTNFPYAAEQKIQLSLSLYDFLQTPDLSEGFEIDWIRSYKLRKGVDYYWPEVISLDDKELSRLHKTVKLGGKNLVNMISNKKITFWATESITLDKNLAIMGGQDIEFRCIISQPSVMFLEGGNEAETIEIINNE